MNARPTTRVAVAAAIVIALVVSGWWWISRSQEKSGTPLAQRTIEQMHSFTPETAERRSKEEKPPQSEERTKLVNQAIERTNVPINFWGKVVDQHQLPIDGVTVRYSYSTEHANPLGIPWGRQEVHKSDVVTDATGAFKLGPLKGHVLTIESLAKDGYNETFRAKRVYNYYGDTSSGKFVPDQAKPIVFVMGNKAVAESLVTYGGSFGKTLRVPGDGTPARWNLWNAQVDPNGELQITFKREPAVLPRVQQPTIWHATVEIVGGGIIEASPEQPLQTAPLEGYVSQLEYPKTQQKHGVPARSFYIKTSNGKYGRIEVNLYPDDDGPTARCLIKGVMNPTGGRDLEAATR